MSKTFYRKFDDMTWPAPCEKMDELEWSLRYGEFVSRKEALAAAAIISAYRQLISDPLYKRQRVINQLKQGPNI
jgi:hypothetical protein